MKLYGSSNNKSFNTLKLRVALAEAGASYELIPDRPRQGTSRRRPSSCASTRTARCRCWSTATSRSPSRTPSSGTSARSTRRRSCCRRPTRGEAARRRGRACCSGATSPRPPSTTPTRSSGTTRSAPRDNRNPKLAEAALGKIARGIGVMESVLATRPWLAGASYSLADLSNASIVFALKRRLPERSARRRAARPRLVRARDRARGLGSAVFPAEVWLPLPECRG